ncbi:MAG: hypothetical protein IH891_02000 [Planctomycetes bacterium]|nr:hypothetical protein [Planctomycetota bacterium]
MTRHRFHSICPYFAMFPEGFVRKHIYAYTVRGDVVFDPFSGRGTTVLESLLQGRVGIGTDLNPVAICLSNAKADPPRVDSVLSRLRGLQDSQPKDFLSIEPYYTNFKRGWGLDDNDLMYICSSDNWHDVYNRLHERYKMYNNNININSMLIDKKLKYMSVLNRVLKNMQDTPCI